MLTPIPTVKLSFDVPRTLTAPDRAFFLFGPRGTGKSTWIKGAFPQARIIDLLPPQTALAYQKDPSLLRREVEAVGRQTWVVVDEVQRAPHLLDEVHSLMESRGHRRFVLTGSSARKLRRGASNLLAGRRRRGEGEPALQTRLRRGDPLALGRNAFAIELARLPRRQGVEGGATWILPPASFLRRLHAGEVLGTSR